MREEVTGEERKIKSKVRFTEISATGRKTNKNKGSINMTG